MGSRPGPGASTGRRSIGVMGGTFDPIHHGHLVTAEIARHAFQLERVVFVPSGQPPHKVGRYVTSGEHRYAMTILATVYNYHFGVSRVELDRTGRSYTVDTVQELRRQFGPAVDIWFITGADAILEITSWKDPTAVLQQCRFIAATRPGYVLDELERMIASLDRDLGDRIVTLQVPGLAISSSDIRHRVHSGEPISYLLPRAVESYIRKHHLYRDARSGREADTGRGCLSDAGGGSSTHAGHGHTKTDLKVR